MNVIDPTTAVGKIRLRIGDWQDLPILPDSVIVSALDDCKQNVPRAAALCAQYVLATLTARTHRKLSQIESWSGEHFTNYVQFLKLTVLNPHMMATAPIPYSGMDQSKNPLVKFSEVWNRAYSHPTTNTNFDPDWDWSNVFQPL